MPFDIYDIKHPKTKTQANDNGGERRASVLLLCKTRSEVEALLTNIRVKINFDKFIAERHEYPIMAMDDPSLQVGVYSDQKKSKLHTTEISEPPIRGRPDRAAIVFPNKSLALEVIEIMGLSTSPVPDRPDLTELFYPSGDFTGLLQE